MPHIKFRGCKIEEVKIINKELVDKLSTLLEIPKDHFTVEYENITFVSDEVYPLVTVLWFNRGDNVKQEVANIITDLIKNNYNDVSIYFEDLIKENYYENKVHF